jgi:hypothetical protein
LVLEDGQGFGVDEQLNAAGDAGLALDQSGAFEGKNHLMDRGRRDAKEALEIGFGRGPAVELRISLDEGQILTLL